MRWKKYLQLIGIILFIWIMFSVEWSQVGKTLLKLEVKYLFGYIFCFFTMATIRAIRLRIALKKLGFSVSNIDCHIAIQEPSFLGLVTPGRLGEFTRVGYINAHGISMPKAIAIVIIEKLTDASILLAISAGGLVYLFAPHSFNSIWWMIILTGLFLLFSLIKYYAYITNLLKKPINLLFRWQPSSLKKYQKSLGNSIYFVIENSTMTFFLLGLVLTALSVSQIFFLAKAFSFEADNLVIFFAYTLATLASMLPISLGGLGTREAAYITIMGREGILIEEALLFSLLDGIVFGFLLQLLIVAPIWFIRLIKNTG